MSFARWLSDSGGRFLDNSGLLSTCLRWLREVTLSIPAQEATFGCRGFHTGQASTVLQLEASGRSFLAGYHCALEQESPAALAARLDAVEAEFRGFAFEGAGMGLALLDFLTPWRANRLQA